MYIMIHLFRHRLLYTTTWYDCWPGENGKTMHDANFCKSFFFSSHIKFLFNFSMLDFLLFIFPLRKKRNIFSRYNLQLNMITLITITFSAIVASTTKDPTVYNIDALQIARGICEVWSLGMTVHILITNIYQIRK